MSLFDICFLLRKKIDDDAFPSTKFNYESESKRNELWYDGAPLAKEHNRNLRHAIEGFRKSASFQDAEPFVQKRLDDLAGITSRWLREKDKDNRKVITDCFQELKESKLMRDQDVDRWFGVDDFAQ